MKLNLLLALSAGLLLGGLGVASAQKGSDNAAIPRSGQQVDQTFQGKITKTVSAQYLIYLPKPYAEDKGVKWPLLLFLHGAGERGSDVNKVKAHGPPRLINEGKEFPFIVVSPQVPEGQWWDPEILNGLLNSVTKKYRVDKDRVYVTGLSMGGFGTWALAMAYPHRFAAIAPIAAGGDPTHIAEIRHLPTWVFHGAKDAIVSIDQDQKMVDALKAAGGDVRFTVYPEAGHDSWTETYNNPELYTWLLSHRRGKD